MGSGGSNEAYAESDRVRSFPEALTSSAHGLLSFGILD